METSFSGWAFLVVVLVLLALAFYAVWQRWLSGHTPKPSTSPFVLNYGSIDQPDVAFDGSDPVPVYVPSADVVDMYTDTYTVSDGDTIVLLDSKGRVVQEKSLALDFVSQPSGDWSLLVNLQHQLEVDGLLTGDYELALWRKGKTMISVRLTPNVKQIRFWAVDPRKQLPDQVYKPFFVGDLLFVADPQTKIVDHIFYCVRDDEGGVFKVHDLSPLKDISILPFVLMNSMLPGKFVALTDANWQEIRSFSTYKNQVEIVNTSVGYERPLEKFPGPNDPTVLDMIPSETKLLSGDTINVWSYLSSIYYSVANVKLEASSSNELSDDVKFLTSGVQSLIQTNNLYGWTLEIVRANVVVLSKTIPSNVTGVRFFVDPRLTLVQFQDSVIVGDIVRAQITTPGVPEDRIEFFWAVNAPMKLYTNGGTFLGTYQDLVAFVRAEIPSPSKVQFSFSNCYSSTPFKVLTVNFP